MRWALLGALVLATTSACGDGANGGTGTTGVGASGGGGSGGDAGGAGGAGGDIVDCDTKAAGCASEFGTLFTNSNGRADGTLVAVVRPSDTQCLLYNDDHVVVQLSMLGQVQRLVVAVDGVAVSDVSAPLVGPAFAEGWHEDVQLDYVTDLAVHSADFTSVSFDDAVNFACAALDVAAPVSVYAYSDGSAPSSAHQIHRNDNYPDGAIVVDPTSSSPRYLLFRYDDQVF